MSFLDLFGTEHVRNFTHFSSLVNIAAVDGEINPREEAVLRRLARQLNIDEEGYQKAIKEPNKFPINPPNTNIERLERLYDMLRIIFADHIMDPKEEVLLKKYAIALGFPPATSQEIIDRSIQILSGQLSFEDYLYLLRRKP